ncbi:MAG: hypothetical protein K1X83_03640 [Oligoflexia bacterium]|nr:hypothetical protein [Oligoflexia bacterium]
MGRYRIYLCNCYVFLASIAFVSFAHAQSTGPQCPELSDSWEVTITSLPYTINDSGTQQGKKIYYLPSTVTGTGAITIAKDNVKLIGPGRDAALTIPGIDLYDRRCVTLKNLHLSGGVGIRGGGHHRLLHSRVTGGAFSIMYASAYNLIEDNIFEPPENSTQPIDLSGYSHHNKIALNQMSKTETSANLGQDRWLHLADTSDNEFENNNFEILNNYGSSEVFMAMYTVQRTIFRKNILRNMCTGAVHGYGIMQRDMSTNNLFDSNRIESSNECATLTFISGSQQGTVTDNMYRNNRIIKTGPPDPAIWMQNSGQINSIIGNVIYSNSNIAADLPDVINYKRLNFSGNTVYSGGAQAVNGPPNGSSNGDWLAKNNIFAGATASNYGSFSAPIPPNLIGNTSLPLFTNAAGLDFSLASGSPALGAGENGSNLGADRSVAHSAQPSPLDIVPPSIPANVTVTPLVAYIPIGVTGYNATNGSVTLKWDLAQHVKVAWDPSTDNVGGRVVAYRVSRTNLFSRKVEYLAESAGSYYWNSSAASMVFAENSFVDWAPMGDSYVYQVQAIDAAGNLSAQSGARQITLAPSSSVSGITYRVARKFQECPRSNPQYPNCIPTIVHDWEHVVDTTSRTINDTVSTYVSATDPGTMSALKYHVSAMYTSSREGLNSLESREVLLKWGPGVDPYPPGPTLTPRNLSSQSVRATQIDLAWEAIGSYPSGSPTEDVARYRLYRSTAGGPETLVKELVFPSTTDSGLSPNTTYTYKISSVGIDNRESAKSAGLTVTTPDGTADTIAPLAPSNLGLH